MCVASFESPVEPVCALLAATRMKKCFDIFFWLNFIIQVGRWSRRLRFLWMMLFLQMKRRWMVVIFSCTDTVRVGRGWAQGWWHVIHFLFHITVVLCCGCGSHWSVMCVAGSAVPRAKVSVRGQGVSDLHFSLHGRHG